MEDAKPAKDAQAQGSSRDGQPVVEYVKQQTAPKVGRKRDIIWIKLLQLRDRAAGAGDGGNEDDRQRVKDGERGRRC